ncbi:RNA polymerase subunit sigma-70 [Burkholderia singularis]|uniref:RNA polymerase subunit sigma-70 n=1 Tax=Burkholderia singularis TaxID=1503053 RepID=A0A103E0B0_9BURK|nr:MULTISPECIES: RNA polymerase factor sigma-70 [Burkholderia]AOK29816.1 RNA polymerase subunit sigma-70 [Burkholderia sp. Bp7605]KVE25985.1 RNA polymerase subunit sigma-70 [Burkholderia singularis]
MAEVLERPMPATSLPIVDACATLAFDVRPPAAKPAAASVPAPARGRRAAQRVHGALVDVLVANRPMLVKLARSFVGCASRAEDVVHDVLVKLVDFPNQDAIRQPVAYVTRMVRNASIDACRRQTLENVYHADEDDGLDVPSPELSPEAALVVRDTLRRACDALAQLPARSRIAFEMVRLRDETLQATARALNVSQTLVHFMVRDAEQHCVACVAASERGDARPAFCGGRARRR